MMRKYEERMVLAICCFMAIVSAAALILIVGKIFIDGLPSLTLAFILTPEVSATGLGQGIANAIVGSFMISIIATLLATPFAIGTAIYLQRYARESPFTKMVRFLIEVLSGTPSIVLGIFGLLVFAFYMQKVTGGFSLIAGSISLAILILPVIERATEDALERVSTELEHGSYALGATKWQTIRNITIPCCASGIVTGAILGFGRAAEESAVVILTAGYSQFLPEFAVKPNAKLLFDMKIYPLQDVIGTLPFSVYHAYENSNVVPISCAFAAAFVLIVIVLLVNLTAKIILWKYGHD
ncbi:phosphate ABC transporter permease PstA [Methanoculleus sp.]|uniref:phosphate ABC transporter permease PstA n=1 Tax=Methanoculleus sp. TaxID=90427 RepID=UPI0025E3B3AA|nr:phosphate ABC transporter permease PstA [Methanoculleus sp.]